MKKLLLIVVLLISGAAAFSQSGGPDAFGYTWRGSNHPQGPMYNWINITSYPGAVRVLSLADDNTTPGFLPVGFQFPYYWYTVSQFKIGSNGYIIFNNGAMSSPFPTIPSAALPNDYIAPFMSDLNFTGTGNTAECWYWSNLTDTLIVSFINVPFWTGTSPFFTGSNTFQIILAKVDSSITFQYLSQTGTTTPTGTYLTIGIENTSGSIGLQHSTNTYPNQLYAVKYYYPSNSTFVVDDATVVFNNNPTSGGLFLSQNGAPFTMSAGIQNTGNQPHIPFDVDMRVLDNSNAIQAQQTLSSSPLAAGQTEYLSATTTFDPVTTGTYKFVATTQLTGDLTPSNDSKTLELVVVDTTQNFVTLSYTGNTAVPAGAGISWTGGNAGVGVEFIPPYYPCYLWRLDFFITANTSAAGFYSLVYDNNGPGNGPGALLDSTHVAAGQVLAPNQWNFVDMPAPIRVDSGSLFIAWMMDGVNITIGTDTTRPISNRTYEVLGSWSIFRTRETEDLMVRAVIGSSAIAGVENLKPQDEIGEFYPSPSKEIVFLNVNLANVVEGSNYAFYNIEGQLVETNQIPPPLISSESRLSFDISKLRAGAYVCKITTGNHQYNRKLIVGK